MVVCKDQLVSGLLERKGDRSFYVQRHGDTPQAAILAKRLNSALSYSHGNWVNNHAIQTDSHMHRAMESEQADCSMCNAIVIHHRLPFLLK